MGKLELLYRQNHLVGGKVKAVSFALLSVAYGVWHVACVAQ